MKTAPPPFVFAVATLGTAVFAMMDALMEGLSLAIGAYDATLWRSVAGTLPTGAIFLAARPILPAVETDL